MDDSPSNPNSEEYELVPRNQLEHLQHEVDRIKHNPFGDSHSSKDLLGAMDLLNKNVAKLVNIFETANDEIVRDYKDQTNSEKLNRVMDQNEKLAKGIVAMADLLKELKEFKAQASASSPQSLPGRPGPQETGSQNPFLDHPPEETESFSPPRRSPSLPPISSMDIPPPPR